ncbi:MAG: hypothetical protein DYG94_12210 [Leptolyngbya sp. PLA3]|nr:MAG: hypothetical protein EDM82_13750 [Cyanobacteria bacterium CYA]MCE7969488.1 hypothetical protein [Leptolyngbya sp. PL-A3]
MIRTSFVETTSVAIGGRSENQPSMQWRKKVWPHIKKTRGVTPIIRCWGRRERPNVHKAAARRGVAERPADAPRGSWWHGRPTRAAF